MSFRTRLTLFFVLVVLVPMVSVAVGLMRLLADVETAKVDARVAAQQAVVIKLYERAGAAAEKWVEGLKPDAQLSEALRDGDCEVARDRLEELVDKGRIARIRLIDEGGDEVCVDGPRTAIAPATRPVETTGGEPLGRVEVSVTRAATFVRRVREIARTGLAVRADGRLLATSLEGVGDRPLPGLGTVEGPQGEDLRVSSFTAPGFGSRRVTLSVLTDQSQVAGAVARGRLLAGAILMVFFLIALVFALAVSRQLQQQVAGLLEAVRRLGRGDFSTRAPTEGGDEFAALGEEFNNMSDQLAARLDEVTRERERVLVAVRRLGATMGASLDRGRLLEIAVTTAVEGVGAHGGRVSIRRGGDAPVVQAARAGSLRGLEMVLR
ncbi:MAG TPA: HAMP domain-containing protein, partial [Solirubrobacteraceae bacterium]|nr:HAMP domain-containing protein [Solirubrobacteraceae bacterium]